MIEDKSMTETMTVTIDFRNPLDRALYRLLTFHRSVRTHGHLDLETLSQLINSSIDVHMAVLRILTDIAEKLGGQSDDKEPNQT